MLEPLTPHWSAWREVRAHELRTNGMSDSDASSAASREARLRMTASKVIGRDAALVGDLITELHANGTFNTFLRVNTSVIPDEKLKSAEKWANRKRPSFQ